MKALLEYELQERLANNLLLQQEEIKDEAVKPFAPHVIYHAKLSKDGNQFCFLLGNNLQEGIAGFGDTPAQAATAFDEAWRTETIPVSNVKNNRSPKDAAQL